MAILSLQVSEAASCGSETCSVSEPQFCLSDFLGALLGGGINKYDGSLHLCEEGGGGRPGSGSGSWVGQRTLRFMAPSSEIIGSHKGLPPRKVHITAVQGEVIIRRSTKPL